MENEKLLPLTNDFVFKNVFGKYGNEDILRSFLKAITKMEIDEIEIQNGELPKSMADEKLGILDVRVRVNKTVIADIEMQIVDERNLGERSMFYVSKLYASQFKTNQKYSEADKIIVIFIINFSYYKREEFHSIAHMKFEEAIDERERVDKDFEGISDQIITDKIEYHIIDLQRFRNNKNKKDSPLANWLWLLDGKDKEEIIMAMQEDPAIEKAKKELEYLSQDEETRQKYEDRLTQIMNMRSAIEKGYDNGRVAGVRDGTAEGLQEGMQEGLQKGMQEGMQKGMQKGIEQGLQKGKQSGKEIAKREIAKEMLLKNMEIGIISQITKLSEDTIKEIEKEIEND